MKLALLTRQGVAGLLLAGMALLALAGQTRPANAQSLLAGLDPAKQDRRAQWLRANRAASLQRARAGARALLAQVRRDLAHHGVPPDLAAIAVLESGLRPRQISGDGFGGLWQLSASLARRHGLRVDQHQDQRLDPRLSTRAAAAHLKFLHRLFDDWTLAVAAYNCGKGRVQRALRRTGGGDFALLAKKRALPGRAINYVYLVGAMIEELRK